MTGRDREGLVKPIFNNIVCREGGERHGRDGPQSEPKDVHAGQSGPRRL